MLNFIIGAMVGGCFGVCCLCLTRLNTIEEYERKIDKLEKRLSKINDADRY